ncbi:aminoacyl-tRNA hydrolase [Sporocytophaga myxococcoides]|uniref:aminoacyl-tRNA hydrolase n=1 Tax=Sporocytophaga myxococcoides TaxID=153721 RepID=UPI0003FFF8C2|nr:aminoacyl-tRNA hydrolase [Sporocytophaga myxococcoides]
MKYLIFGLGNIGPEYELTRHNIGFLVLDRLADKEGLKFRSDRYAFVTEYKYKGRTLLLIKPTTFMNLSGKTVNYWMKTENVSAENIMVITDDIALPYGTLRMRSKGSNGGHNGLGNIQQVLGSEVYPRLRFGVGSEFSKGRQVDYVLGKFSSKEFDELPIFMDKAIDGILAFCTIGIERAMNTVNTK